MSLSGTSCYPITITQDTVPLRGDPRKLEAIGQWCFTPSSNMLDASGMCVIDTASGPILAVGNFQGTVQMGSEFGSGTTIRAHHSESVLIND